MSKTRTGWFKTEHQAQDLQIDNWSEGTRGSYEILSKTFFSDGSSFRDSSPRQLSGEIRNRNVDSNRKLK